MGRLVITLALLSVAIGTGVLALAPPLAVGVLASAVVGLGAGIPFGPMFSSAQRLRPDRPAAAVGLVNFVANAAIVIGVPLAGLTFSMPGDGRIGLIAIALLSVAALVVMPSAAVFGHGLRSAAYAESGSGR